MRFRLPDAVPSHIAIMADNNEEILEDLQNDDLDNADEDEAAPAADAVRTPFPATRTQPLV